MKEYSPEVDNYLAGLEHCPGDESLMRGLQAARRHKLHASKASRAAKMNQATQLAALSRRQKAHHATDLSSFVEQTHKNLELEVLALHAQINLIKEMNMLVDSKKLDLIHSWLSAVTSPKLSTLQDLAVAIQQAAASLPFGEDYRHALEKVDCKKISLSGGGDDINGIGRAELETFLNVVVIELNTTLMDMLQFIISQVVFSSVTGGKPSPKEQQLTASRSLPSTPPAVVAKDRTNRMNGSSDAPKSVLNDERVQHLFVLFDKDSNSTVDFKEIALGLYPFTRNMGEAAKKAAGLLLMVDKDDQRELSYEQFARLILAVAAAFGMSYGDLVDQLTYELAQQSGTPVDPSVMQEIMVVESAYAEASDKRKEENQRQKTMDALLYSRTQKLFELWDTDGSGSINFSELLHGLRRYQKAVTAGGATLTTAERDALIIMGHDDDHNQSLDPEEFAHAMANYAEKADTTLHELIDFMCVVSSSTTDTLEYEAKFAEVQQHVQVHGSTFKPTMGTIIDTNGDEDDEEEEDDW